MFRLIYFKIKSQTILFQRHKSLANILEFDHAHRIVFAFLHCLGGIRSRVRPNLLLDGTRYKPGPIVVN